MSDTSISVKVKSCFYCNFDAFISLTKLKDHIKVRRAYFISLLIFKYIISSMDFDFEMPYFLLKSVLCISDSTVLGYRLGLHHSFSLSVLC